ncbi:MAG: DUF11 domain-containing protein [Anaerolineae bacterium]|nr:DUF11 domain-containing protein [Anaerolineae bacterium]
MMEQFTSRKQRKILVAAMVFAAVCLGAIWFSSFSLAARADGTMWLETSYKDASPREVSPGGTVTYTIVLRNDDPMSATGDILVADILDPRLAFVEGSEKFVPSWGGHRLPPDQGLKFEFEPIAAHTNVTLTFQAIVTTTVQAGNVITNVATISEGTNLYTRSVTVTVAALPTAQIVEPWNQQFFTQRGTVVIKGRVWVGSMPEGYPQAPVLSPISNGGGAFNQYVVQWQSVPDAQLYTLQESGDPNFSAISDEQTTTNLSIAYTNKTRNRTYYYRVQAFTGNYESRWSNVQSVTVNPAMSQAALPPAEFAPQAVLAPSAGPLVDVIVTRQGGGGAPQIYPAIVSPDPLGGDWWNWAYTWTLPIEDEETSYTIQSRGKDAVGNYDPDKIDAITVVIKNGTRYIYLPVITKRYPPIPYPPTLSVSNNDTYGTYQLNWAYSHSQFTPTSYRLQESTDSKFNTLTANDTFAANVSSKSYVSKPAGTYYYRIRGINSAGEGEWSSVITVVCNPAVPFSPVLVVDSDNTYGIYQLSWTYPHTQFPPTTYRFQEASDANFTTLTINEVLAAGTTTRAFSGKAAGTYYYRVRGVNLVGEGAWSNVITIAVSAAGYYDDFSNANSGWFRGTLQESGRNVVSGLYTNGTYRLKVMLDSSSLNNYRMGIIPAPYTHTDSSYDVEVDHVFKKADDQAAEPTGGKAGLVFRGDYNSNGYFTTIYVVEWNFEGGCAVYKYSNIKGKLTDVRGNAITWDPLREWEGGCVSAGYDKNVHARVEVRGNGVNVYLGSKFLGSYGGIGGVNRFGVLTGSWERTPVESAFDNFKITEK